MKPTGEGDSSLWSYIEQLFKLRKGLLKARSEKKSYLDAVKVEEVESMLHAKLRPQVRSIVFAIVQGNLQDEVVDEVASEAIQNLFDGYTAFRGDASLRAYFASIVKNAMASRLKKMSREKKLFTYDEQDLIHADSEAALRMFREREGRERQEAAAVPVADLFELIDFQEQNLTDKEFVVIVLKFANLRMEKKLTDEELARTLGMKRTTFLDSFKRGADKICRYWKDKKSHGE